MKKTSERFKLIVADYQKIISEICDDNDDYSLSKSDLLDQFDTGKKVFKFSHYCSGNDIKIVPDDNDPKKLFVSVYDSIVGIVKAGSVSHFRNLMSSPESKIFEVEMYGGNYKQITYDEDVDSFKDNEYYADLYVYTASSAPAAPVPPATPVAPEPEKRGFLSRLFKK